MTLAEGSLRPHAPLWIERFPWCRAWRTYLPRNVIPILNELRVIGYPEHVEECTFLVEETRFIRYMRMIWGIRIDPSDLNALEFYGLMIPVRKAIARPLLKAHLQERPSAVECWLHRGFVCSTSAAKPAIAGGYHLLPIDPAYGEAVSQMPVVRPTPKLVIVEEDTENWRAAVSEPVCIGKPLGEYPIRLLRQSGLWWKPTDPYFWALLAPNPFSSVLRDQDRSPSWVRQLAPVDFRRLMRLSVIEACNGNEGVTRFYLIGGMRRSLDGSPGFKNGLGQDWWLAEIMYRLGSRNLTTVALAMETEAQRQRVNAKRKAHRQFQLLWRELASKRGLPLPPLLPHFHRNALLWLTHQSRPKRVSDLDSYESLGNLAELSPESIKTFANRGQRALRVE